MKTRSYTLSDAQVQNIFACIEATWKGRNIDNEPAADALKELRVTLAQQLQAHQAKSHTKRWEAK